MAMSHFSDKDKLSCLERELQIRQIVFERRVKRGAMSREQMNWEIGCMEAIASDYRAKVQVDQPVML